MLQDLEQYVRDLKRQKVRDLRSKLADVPALMDDVRAALPRMKKDDVVRELVNIKHAEGSAPPLTTYFSKAAGKPKV